MNSNNFRCSLCSRPVEPRDLTFEFGPGSRQLGITEYVYTMEGVTTKCCRGEVLNDDGSELTDDQLTDLFAAEWERQERTGRDSFGE